MNDPWLIANTPDGIHCWHLQPDTDIEEAAMAARSLLGAPPGTAVMLDETPWDVQVTFGEPHEKLLARATVRDGAELARVDVTSYRTAGADADRADRIRDARAHLDALDDQAKTQLLAAYGRVATAAPTKAGSR